MMQIFAYVIMALWVVFIVAYVAVRVSMPKMKNRTVKQIKNDAGYDDDGYDARGFSPLGFHRNGTRYDEQGLDRNGNRKPDTEE